MTNIVMGFLHQIISNIENNKIITIPVLHVVHELMKCILTASYVNVMLVGCQVNSRPCTEG